MTGFNPKFFAAQDTYHKEQELAKQAPKPATTNQAAADDKESIAAAQRSRAEPPSTPQTMLRLHV